MAVIVRVLGIGVAAAAATLLMSVGVGGPDGGGGGANIGAGLAAFALLAGGGFTWALVDGLDLGSTRRREQLRLSDLLVRWVLASVGAVAVVVAAMVGTQGSGYLADVGASSVVFLIGVALVPAVVGALIGRAAQPTVPDAVALPVSTRRLLGSLLLVAVVAALVYAAWVVWLLG